MHFLRFVGVFLLTLTAPLAARAGLYYSEEHFAELPSQWRGFLLDQRALRNIAVKPTPRAEASPARIHYQEAALKLEKTRQARALSAEELADLGALYIRLGEADKAVAVLRPALAAHPNHFHIA